jgi:hypothetical protein
MARVGAHKECTVPRVERVTGEQTPCASATVLEIVRSPGNPRELGQGAQGASSLSRLLGSPGRRGPSPGPRGAQPPCPPPIPNRYGAYASEPGGFPRRSPLYRLLLERRCAASLARQVRALLGTRWRKRPRTQLQGSASAGFGAQQHFSYRALEREKAGAGVLITRHSADPQQTNNRGALVPSVLPRRR